MARHSAFATAISDTLTLSRVAGILSLGVAALLETSVVTPYNSSPRLLILPVLLVALIQIVSGLNERRHENIPEAVIMVAFGLFTCSQVSQLISPSAGIGQGVFLLLWGIFSLLVASQSNPYGGRFTSLLYSLAATLFLKGLLVLTAWTFLWPLALFAGFTTLAIAVWLPLKHLALLRG